MLATLRLLGLPLLLASCSAAKPSPSTEARTNAPLKVDIKSVADAGSAADSAHREHLAATPSASATPSALPSALPLETPPESVQAQFERELQRAKAGEPATLTMRVWRCGASCTCPQPCLEAVHPDLPATWLEVLDREGKPLKLADWTSADLIGKFTGKTIRKSGPSPEVYSVVQFRMTAPAKVRGVSMGPDFEDAEFKVVTKP